MQKDKLINELIMTAFLNKYFKINNRKGKLSTEIIGGLVTFFAMCYIVPVNANILKDIGMDSQGVFAMTALLSGAVTILMGVLANYPIALSAGMGLNAFIAYTVGINLGYSWQECMVILFFTGLLYFLLTITKIRKKIVDAIPQNLRVVIACGLGGFICLVGLKSAGIIVSNESTLISLGNILSAPVWLSLIGTALIFFLYVYKTKHTMINKLAIPMGIVFVAIVATSLYYIGNACGTDYFKDCPRFEGNWGMAGVENVFFFGAFNTNDPKVNQNIGQVFTNVLCNYKSYIAIFSLLFVKLFDTTATVVTVGKEIGADEGGKEYRRAILVDASGSLIPGVVGTSMLTPFAESNCGVSVGAKTGLASVITGLAFVAEAFIFPIFSIFSYSCVTAPALIMVGCIVFTVNIKDIAWHDIPTAFAGFITIIMIILTYNLTNGIGFGLFFYTIMMLAQRRYKELNPILIVVVLLFVACIIVNSALTFQ